MRKICCFIFIMIAGLAGNAQNKKTDSLRSLLVQEKNDTARLHIMLSLANIYRHERNDSALLYCRDALQLSEKIENVRYQIKARSVMATYLYEVRADYASSLDLYLQNIKKEQETGDTSRIIWDTRGAQFIYEDIGNYSKALEYVNQLKSLVNSDKFKSNPLLPDYKILADFRLGSVYNELKKPDSAKKYLLRVYNLGVSGKDSTWAALSSGTLGETYSALKQADSAQYYFKVSMSLALQVERLDIYGESLLGLADLYWQNKRLDSAFVYAAKAYHLVKEEHLNDIAANTASLLSEIYYAKKQPDSAYAYLKQSVKFRDSLLSQDKISRIQSLTTEETLQKIEDEQTKKEAINEYRSSIKIYSLSAGLAILVVFLFVLYRNNIQRRTANKKIAKAYDDLKSAQTQLIQSEKMASLGELTAGIAHEIQNPLNFVNNFSDVNREMLEELKAESEKPKAERDEQVEKELINDLIENETKINHHGRRADSIVKGMLQHSRASSGQKELTDINALADEYLRLAYHGFRAKDKEFNVELVTHFDAKLPKVEAVPQDIGRVLLNIISNAFYAVRQKEKTAGNDYKPTVEVSTVQRNGFIVVKVKDNGTGIPENIREKIMQPFFTTKPTGEGTGLGLSLSYDIVVKGHGGKISVESKEGEGSEFNVTLPA